MALKYVKKFVAPSFHAACTQLRDEFGPDAMILETNRVKHGGVFGYFGTWMFEVTGQKPDPDAYSPTRVHEIQQLLARVMRISVSLQHRHKGRATIEINDEYDVQDLLVAVLQASFDDIRTEEPSPSHAGQGTRADILLKSEKTVVEVKCTRDGLRDKELCDQMLLDIARYRAHPDCRYLMFYIYDRKKLVRNPAGIIKDIESHSSQQVTVAVMIAQ